VPEFRIWKNPLRSRKCPNYFELEAYKKISITDLRRVRREINKKDPRLAMPINHAFERGGGTKGKSTTTDDLS